MKVSVTLYWGDDGMAKVRIPAAHKPIRRQGQVARVWLVLFDCKHSTAVRSGENRGKAITSANVVRSIHEIGTWRGKKMEITLPLAALGSKGRDGCAILVQAGRVGPILGAAMMSLAHGAGRTRR